MDGEKLQTLPEAVAEMVTKEEEEKIIAETPPAYLLKYTLDGEVLVEKKGESIFVHPLKDVDLLPVPDKFKEIHMSEMKMFHSLVRTIKRLHPQRAVPVTRKELFKVGATTKLITQLCEMGYLKEALVDFIDKTGKSTGVRSCYFYTPQGRALIRAKLDPDYAKTGYN